MTTGIAYIGTFRRATLGQCCEETGGNMPETKDTQEGELVAGGPVRPVILDTDDDSHLCDVRALRQAPTPGFQAPDYRVLAGAPKD